MNSTQVKRPVPVLVGAATIIAMAVITAGCGGGTTGPASTTTTTTTTTTTATTTPPPPVSTTENQIDPNGPNLFTPNPIPVEPAPSQNPHRRESPGH